MTRSKWPTYDPATDGNPYRWIVTAARRARDPENQRDRQEAEAARIAERARNHGRSHEDPRKEAGE